MCENLHCEWTGNCGKDDSSSEILFKFNNRIFAVFSDEANFPELPLFVHQDFPKRNVRCRKTNSRRSLTAFHDPEEQLNCPLLDADCVVRKGNGGVISGCCCTCY